MFTRPRLVRFSQLAHQQTHAVAVLLPPFAHVLPQQIGGPQQAALREVGKAAHHQPLAAARLQGARQAAQVAAQLGDHLHAHPAQQAAQAAQALGAVVVPGDHDAGDAQFLEAQEELEHRALGTGGRVHRIEQVSGHQHGVGALAAGQSGDLAQGVAQFRGAVIAACDSSRVEIGGVEYAHGLESSRWGRGVLR